MAKLRLLCAARWPRYPLGEQRHASSFHLLLDAVRSELRVDINRVYVFNEATGDDGDTIVLGSCVLLERRLPSAEELGVEDWRVRDAGSRVLDEDVADPLEAGQVPCRCAVDEAIGLALALGVSPSGAECLGGAALAGQHAASAPASDLRHRGIGESDGQETALAGFLKRCSEPSAARRSLRRGSCSRRRVCSCGRRARLSSVGGRGASERREDPWRIGRPAVADDFLTALMELPARSAVSQARRALAGDEPFCFSRAASSAADPEMFTLSTVLRGALAAPADDVAAAAEDFSTAARRQAELEARQSTSTSCSRRCRRVRHSEPVQQRRPRRRSRAAMILPTSSRAQATTGLSRFGARSASGASSSTFPWRSSTICVGGSHSRSCSACSTRSASGTGARSRRSGRQARRVARSGAGGRGDECAGRRVRRGG